MPVGDSEGVAWCQMHWKEDILWMRQCFLANICFILVLLTLIVALLQANKTLFKPRKVYFF